ncbi:fimbrial protein [Enterobacter sp. SES19]|uniref:fimbrial protein n=1 Tax=unclassified Enterobacter TaxID=2608935 RepID=UPI0008E565EA|nr:MULTISPECIES: fimbrial protein [unclassified Enterobacter]QIR21622.1 fimbrial protein [Enterobacter sp. SES19]SFI37748.1 Pilin (type 1 fimbria component protein) [Enterobacter sp. NFIX59]
MNLHFSMKTFFLPVLMLLATAFFHSARADCTFNGSSGVDAVVTFQLPPVIIVAPDTPKGTIIYDDSVESKEVAIDCTGEAQIRRGYLSLTESDAREDVMPGVYQTNVPGIGIRAASSNEQLPNYNDEDLVRPMHYIGSTHGYSHGVSTFRATAQLVITGDIQEGYLDTSRLTSMDILGNVVIGEMRFSPASVRITTNTCNLVDRNIYVPLKTVNVQDFDGQYSEILTDSSFKIEITDCSAGTKIDYQFTSAGSTGVKNGNILGIAAGDSAAAGVGIQILDKNNTVLQFDQNYTAITSTQDKIPVEIPLKARYIKTGEVKAGKVDSVATFEVFYR